MTTIKRRLERLIDERSGEWLDEQVVWLGDYDETVLTDVSGVLSARQVNGKVIRVHNSAHVPPTFDLQVRIGRSKSLPTIWQIIAVRETYISPAAGGELAYHHEQHEFPGGDTVWIDPKQIMRLTVLVEDGENFIVRVIGSVIRTTSGLAQIGTQSLDLSSYVVTAGAKFLTIQADDDGVLGVVEGDVFGSPLIATFEDVPAPDADKYMIAFVLLYEGQTELVNDDIRIPFMFHGGGTTFVTWGNITGTLADQTDLQDEFDLKADAGHEHVGIGAELLMEDGVTFPPVPLTNETGDDWMYDN